MFKKCGVTWVNQVQYFNQTFGLVDFFVLRIPVLLKPANSYCSIENSKPT